MKQFLSFAIIALLSGPHQARNYVSAQVDFTQHGNYRPPYTDDDQKEADDDDIMEDGEAEVVLPFKRPKTCIGLALSDGKNLGPY